MKISKVQFAQYCNLFRSIELFLTADNHGNRTRVDSIYTTAIKLNLKIVH